jgi:cytochrome d ubiquinol oxidase subunit II
MVETWYAILAGMLALFVVLDGWNIGAGILHHRLAPTDAERRDVIRALGPGWGWSETWLVAFGGCLFLAFPKAYASVFSGFYLAFFVLLWLLIIRALAIELGHVVDDRLWRSLWDALLRASSLGLALLIGVAAGNAIRGFPLDADGWFALPFFTDFTTRGEVGLLDWYTLAAGIFTVIASAAHGSAYVALRDIGPVGARAEQLTPRLWLATVAALAGVSLATWAVRPSLIAAMATRPLGWIGFAIVLAGAAAVLAAHRPGRPARRGLAFVGSCAAIVGVVVNGAVGMFPLMLASTSAQPSLTAYDVAATHHNLAVAIPWWTVAALLAAAQLAFITRYRSAPRRGTATTSGVSA